jgi:hypothetical protein
MTLFSGFAKDERNVLMTKKSLVLFLLFVGQGYGCIYPNREGLVFLKEGHKLCTSEEQIYIGPHYSEVGISYYFDTASFLATVDSNKGCIYGDCGTVEQCSKNNGRALTVTESLISKSHCKLVESNFFYKPCFIQKSCWLWTQKINILERWKVYKTGHLIPFTKAIKGIHLRQLQPVEPMYLVVGRVSYLCPFATGINDPRKHQLGDLQIVSSNYATEWDWDCQFDNIVYDGSCMIPKSFIKAHINDYCSMLPANIGDYRFEYINNVLIATPINGWPATSELVLLKDDPSHCHTVEGRIVGREGLNDDSIAIRVLGHSDAIISVNISCYPDLLEIPCDEDWHDYPLPKLGDCLLNGKELSDMRFKVSVEDDSENATIIIKPHYYSYAALAILILVLIVFIIIKIILKIIC